MYEDMRISVASISRTKAWTTSRTRSTRGPRCLSPSSFRRIWVRSWTRSCGLARVGITTRSATLITRWIGFEDIYTAETFRRKYQKARADHGRANEPYGRYLLVYGVPPANQYAYLARALTAEGYPITVTESLARFTGLSMPSVIERVEGSLGRKLPSDFLDRVQAETFALFRRDLKPVPWVREATVRLLSMDNIKWFSVEAENFESIHNHNAYASLTRDKRGR